MIPIVHHPGYILPEAYVPTPKANKNQLIRDALRTSGEAIEWIEPSPMPLDWLRRVHDPDYVAEVVEARVPPAKERRIGFPVTPPVAWRSQLVPGGTYQAALTAKARGYAANSGGGSHHALYDTGAGYCVFNDLAIAAVRLVEEREAARVLIVRPPGRRHRRADRRAAGDRDLFDPCRQELSGTQGPLNPGRAAPRRD